MNGKLLNCHKLTFIHQLCPLVKVMTLFVFVNLLFFNFTPNFTAMPLLFRLWMDESYDQKMCGSRVARLNAQGKGCSSWHWYNFTFYHHITLLTGSILWQSGIKVQQNFLPLSVVLPSNQYLNMKVSSWKSGTISNIKLKFQTLIEMICSVRHCRPFDRRCGCRPGLPWARLPQGRLPRCLPQVLRLRKSTFITSLRHN